MEKTCDLQCERIKALEFKRRALVLETRLISLQIRSVRRTATQRIKDLGLVTVSVRKRLIEIERLSRDTDLRFLHDQKAAIDREIFEVDRLILTLRSLP